jgi:hypothetical protein
LAYLLHIKIEKKKEARKEESAKIPSMEGRNGFFHSREEDFWRDL